MNEQREIMEKLKPIPSGGIKEERKKALKGKYQKAELVDFRFKETATGDCSDMASFGCPLHKIFCTTNSQPPNPAGCCSIRA